MRASSLSDARVIELLSRYFVSVWLSTDDYDLVPKDKKEAEEYLRYLRLAKAQGLGSGSVQAVIIQPSGALTATLGVVQAAQPEKLLALLENTIRTESVRPRAAVLRVDGTVRPKPMPAGRDVLVLHVGARHLGEHKSWGLAENWVDLKRAEWVTFVPQTIKPGMQWAIAPAAADHIYQCFYPPLPNYRASKSTVESAALLATIDDVRQGEICIGLRGAVKLKHGFGSQDSETTISARVTGSYRVHIVTRKVSAFQLVTEEATFIRYWQGKPSVSRLEAFVEMAK